MSAGGPSQARFAHMHGVMAGHIERGELPGLVTLVSRRGEVHVEVIGSKTVGTSDPISASFCRSSASARAPDAV